MAKKSSKGTQKQAEQIADLNPLGDLEPFDPSELVREKSSEPTVPEWSA